MNLKLLLALIRSMFIQIVTNVSMNLFFHHEKLHCLVGP